MISTPVDMFESWLSGGVPGDTDERMVQYYRDMGWLT